MGTLSIFNIGTSALNAQRLALDVTSENITNVNTPGYSRQTAILETAPTTLERGFPLGSGVDVAQVQRAYDSFLQQQITSQNSTSGDSSTLLNSMTRVQQLFNDLTTNGLSNSLQSFFASWQDLTNNPQGQPERQAVLADAQQLVDDFHRINGALNDVKSSANQSLTGLTSDINDDLKQIASLNQQIKDITIQSGSPNELLDKRDQVVKDLAGKVGITYVTQNDGTLSVSLSLGQPLVLGNQAATLSLQADASNSGYYKVMSTPPGGSTAVDITSIVGGPNNTQGEMGGTLQVRDTLVNGFLSKLDELAATMANQVNSFHSTGYGVNGSTGLNFFTPPATVTGYSGQGGIALNITSTDDIAASDTDPTTATGGTGNNRNAQNIASVGDQVYAMSIGSTTLSGFYDSLVGQVGVSVQSAQRSSDQSSAIQKQLDNLRESNAGVSLDEELANLIKYQQAYEGAAKLITTGTQMMDTVLGMVQ